MNLRPYKENIKGIVTWVNDTMESLRTRECLCANCKWDSKYCDRRKWLDKKVEKIGFRTITTTCPFWSERQESDKCES